MACLNQLKANKLSDYQILKLAQAGCLQRNILSGDLKDPISVIVNVLEIALRCMCYGLRSTKYRFRSTGHLKTHALLHALGAYVAICS